MKKNNLLRLSVIFGLTLILTGAIAVFSSSNKLSFDNFNLKAAIPECEYHHGYHYAEKAATIDHPGHKEFWTCCTCQRQYIVKPNGSFIDQDDVYMIGAIDEHHIAYIPPLTSGGENGDYWTTDTFDDDFEGQPKTRIVVLAGQSNAAGVGYFDCLTQSVDAAKINEIKNGYENVLITGYSHGHYLDGYQTVYADETTATVDKVGTFGPEIGIADRLSKAFPDETIYIVKYAYGGTSLNYDLISPSARGSIPEVAGLNNGRGRGWQYDDMVTCLQNLISDLYMTTDTVPSIEALMWMQGESDAVFEVSKNNYLVTFNAFMNDFKSTFAHNLSSDFALYDAEINDCGYWQYSSEINTAKRSRADENNIILDTNARLTTQYEPINNAADFAHYDAASYIDLGHMFADAYLAKTLRTYEQNTLEITSPTSISMTYGQNYTIGAPTVKFNNASVNAILSYYAEQTRSGNDTIFYFTVNGSTFTPTRRGTTNLRITAYYNNEVRTVVIPVTIS